MGAFLLKSLGRIVATAVVVLVLPIVVGALIWGLAESSHDRKEFADENSDAIQEILEDFPGAGPFPYVRHGQRGEGSNNDTIGFEFQGWDCEAVIDRWSEEVVSDPVCTTAYGGVMTTPNFVGKAGAAPKDEKSLGKPQRKIGSHKGVNGLDAKERAAAILAGRDHAQRAQKDGLGKVFAYSGR